MIVAREPEQSDYELRRREQLLSKFRAPEGVRIYDLAGQKVFKVATSIGFVGFQSYLTTGKRFFAFDPHSESACNEAVAEFQVGDE